MLINPQTNKQVFENVRTKAIPADALIAAREVLVPSGFKDKMFRIEARANMWRK